MELKLEKVKIRNWKAGDETSLVQHANDYQIFKNLRNSFPYPYTFEDAETWIELNKAGDSTNFALEIEGKAVGGIGFVRQQDVYYKSAEIGYWLGAPFWGRGIMTDAVIAVVDFAFTNYELLRIYAGVFENNKASAKVLEKSGFTLEARLKKSITKEGITMDELLYSIVR